MKARILFGCGCGTTFARTLTASMRESGLSVRAVKHSRANVFLVEAKKRLHGWLFQDRMLARSSLGFELWKLREHLMGRVGFRC